jgi:tetratricopeptide (TPR) repeat protein
VGSPGRRPINFQETRMTRRSLPLLLAFTLACAAHEKSGDRAAALGDWRTAEREYAAAVAKEPEKKELQEKYRQAKAAALEDATKRAQACQVARDWECAFGEADYALGLDPTSATLAALRRDAGREVGYLRLRRATESASRRDWATALQLVEGARAATDDPGVAAEGRRVEPAVVRGAVDEAERFRAARQFPEAVDLLARAARVDPSLSQRLEAVRAEHERWKDAEAERYSAEGDALLSQRRFADAKASYDAAVHLRPQGRAHALARCAALLAQGDAAIGRRDFPAAERAFAEAARLEVDGGIALAELDRVKVRPYAIRLRSVLVHATRPDGWPWAGTRTRGLDRALARLTSYTQGRASAPVGVALDLARRIPPENQPTLVVTLALPDGRASQSAPRRGVYALLDGTIVVAGNAYDERTISLRVVHDAGGGRMTDVGLVSFRVADLVANGEVALSEGSVTELRIEADVADQPEGTFSGLTQIGGPPAPAPAAPPVRPAPPPAR